jgi:hypothetical protein
MYRQSQNHACIFLPKKYPSPAPRPKVSVIYGVDQILKHNIGAKKKEFNGDANPRTSCMLSERSTIRATSPHVLTVYLISISCQMSFALCHWLPRTQKPTAACMHACYRPSATTVSRVHIVVDDRVHAAVAGESMQCRSSKRLTIMLQVQGPLVSRGVLISAEVLRLARRNKRFTWIILVFT